MRGLAFLEERVGAPDKPAARVGCKTVVADRADPLRVSFCHVWYGQAA